MSYIQPRIKGFTVSQEVYGKQDTLLSTTTRTFYKILKVGRHRLSFTSVLTF